MMSKYKKGIEEWIRYKKGIEDRFKFHFWITWMHYLNNNKCFFNIQSKDNTQSHKNCWFDRVIQQRLDRLRPGLSLQSSKELTASNYYPHAPLKTNQLYCTGQNLISHTHPDLSVHTAKTTRVKYPRKGNYQMVFPQANKCVKPKVHKQKS